MNKIICITGSDGLIGTSLCEYFLSNGNTVIGIDDLSRYGNIVRPHHNHKNFRYLKDDVKEIKSTGLEGVDVFIHCAYEAGGINWWNHDHELYYRRNRAISLSVIDFLKVSNIPWIVWMSSSQVYENTINFPTAEDDVNKYPPTSGYAREKLQSEQDIMNCSLASKTTILRLFNVVGGEELKCSTNDRGHVVIDLARKIKRSGGIRPIILQGDGQQKRSFTMNIDMMDAVGKIVLNENNVCGIFNICGSEEITIETLAQRLWNCCWSTDPIIEFDNRLIESDVSRRVGDNKLIQKNIEWQPANNWSLVFKKIMQEVQ